MGKVRKVCGGILGVLGFALFVIGVVVKWSIFPQVMEDLVYENLKLEKGTEGWNAFVEPPVPVYMKLYFFNVDNVEAVISKGSKPFLREVGPYVYKEVRRKEDLLEVEGDQLLYSQYMEYYFDEEESLKSNCSSISGQPCSDQDHITVLNGAMAGVGAVVGPLLDTLEIPQAIDDVVISFFNMTTIELVFYVTNHLLITEPFKESVFKEVTVEELVFKGYNTGLLNIITKLDKTLLEILSYLGIGDFPNVDVALGFLQLIIGDAFDAKEEFYALNATISDFVSSTPQIAGGTFGIFKGKNATKADSYYRINTGKYEKHNFMELEEVNGKEELPEEWWPNVAPTPTGQDAGVKGICHEIYGTDGQQFPPFVDKETRIWIYVGELCRSLWMDFDSEIELHGVPVYRYRPASDVFAMSNPNNFCYCPYFDQCATRAEEKDEWNTTKCADICMDGMLYVSTCYGGAPIVMTTPHFYLADKSLIEAVDGMSEPEIAKHETSLDVEPITGATMAAHKRIQINMPLVKIDGLTLLSNVPELIFPIMWADETAELDEENADKFKSMVLVPSKIVDGVAIGIGMVLGAILFFVGLFLIIWKGKSSYKS